MSCQEKFKHCINMLDSDNLKVSVIRELCETLEQCPIKEYNMDEYAEMMGSDFDKVRNYKYLTSDLERRAQYAVAHEGLHTKQVLTRQLPWWQRVFISSGMKHQYRTSTRFVKETASMFPQ